jgi:7-keto-8-aminopelargonate synthetase-like enzyme
MSHPQSPHQLPAPCIIDTGTIVNKQDIERLLGDLSRVHYIHTLDGKLQNEGEGCVLEVFADPHRSTLIANRALYINVHSFDYLQLSQSPEKEAYFDLIQDNRQLRLIPLSNPLQEHSTHQLNADALEAMVTQVLSARWDVQIDDEGECPF